jgi:SAM-dependent methyltransferase
VFAPKAPYHLIISDHSAAFLNLAAQFVPTNAKAVESVLCEGEHLPVTPQSCDLVLSALYLHWMNDLPGLLAQMRLALRPDGLACVNLLGGRSLHELRACLSEAESEISGGVSPRCMPMADIRDMGGLLQRAGFALPVADAELLTITYPDMFKLMADLRGMGGQNALFGRLPHFTRRQIFIRAAEIYQDRFTNEDGQITASIELITLTGWAPDASQPRPLARGSANTSFDAAFAGSSDRASEVSGEE